MKSNSQKAKHSKSKTRTSRQRLTIASAIFKILNGKLGKRAEKKALVPLFQEMERREFLDRRQFERDRAQCLASQVRTENQVAHQGRLDLCSVTEYDKVQ